METSHEKDSIRQEIQTRYRIQLSQFKAADYQLEPEQVQETDEETERLRTKLEAGGPVNLLAIDEYNELKTRYEFLLGQKND